MADVQLSTLGATIKTAYEGQADTNALTDSEKSALINLSSNLASKASLTSPVFTGTVTLPTTQFADSVVTRAELKDIAESYLDAGVKTGTASFDYTAASWQKCVTGGTDISAVVIANPPASGRVGQITLEIHQGTTARTIAWGSAFRFPSGVDSTLTASANAIDIFTLITRDGGTTWYVFEGGKNFLA